MKTCTFYSEKVCSVSQLGLGRVIYLKRKPYDVVIEKSFETGRIFVMRGSRRVLVKLVLLKLRGHGYPQDDAMPNFYANSKESF